MRLKCQNINAIFKNIAYDAVNMESDATSIMLTTAALVIASSVNFMKAQYTYHN